LTNTSDQTTAKVHKFTREFAKEMVDRIKSDTSFKMSEIIMFDIAMYRLMEEFHHIDWKNKTKVNHFMEELLNEIFEIQKKHVNVKIRNIPTKKMKVPSK